MPLPARFWASAIVMFLCHPEPTRSAAHDIAWYAVTPITCGGDGGGGGAGGAGGAAPPAHATIALENPAPAGEPSPVAGSHPGVAASPSLPTVTSLHAVARAA